jgi:colicin import membrane protein
LDTAVKPLLQECGPELERQRREARKAYAEQKSLTAELKGKHKWRENERKAEHERRRQIAQWSAAIKAKIQRLWRKPESASKGESCQVYVRQTTGGYIEDVKVQQCTGDEEFRRSIEAAVLLASPLPPPPTPEIFDHELVFTFIPEG